MVYAKFRLGCYGKRSHTLAGKGAFSVAVLAPIQMGAPGDDGILDMMFTFKIRNVIVLVADCCS